MKIAVCLAGHMRTYRETYDSWYNHVLNKHDCDVFISTWDNYGGWKQQTDGVDHKNHGTVSIDDVTIELSHVKDLYNPIGLQVESYTGMKDHFEKVAKPIYEWRDTLPELYHNYRVNSYISALYKVWSANHIKNMYEQATGTQYDMVLMSRPDIAIEALPEGIEDTLDSVHVKGPIDHEVGWIWNIMFATNNKNADCIANLYELYEDKFDEAREANTPHKFFEPHNVIYFHLTDHCKLNLIDDISCEMRR